jgi:hypothetical protein
VKKEVYATIILNNPLFIFCQSLSSDCI